MAYSTCSERFLSRYLCEAADKKSSDFSRPEAVRFPNPPPSGSFSVRMTSCPGGHVVHEFLACDVPSACWACGLSPYGSCAAAVAGNISGFCKAPLTPLPPSFHCSSGVDVIPYTLICDHRPDCGDRSDEHFCVFPPCHPFAQFDCGAGQVSPVDTRFSDFIVDASVDYVGYKIEAKHSKAMLNTT